MDCRVTDVVNDVLTISFKNRLDRHWNLSLKWRSAKGHSPYQGLRLDRYMSSRPKRAYTETVHPFWPTSVHDRIFKLASNDPCHSNEVFACCHKNSASVNRRRVTITLGFSTLFLESEFPYISDAMKRLTFKKMVNIWCSYNKSRVAYFLEHPVCASNISQPVSNSMAIMYVPSEHLWASPKS